MLYFVILYLDAEIGITNEENKKLVTEDYLGLTDGEDVDILDHSLIPFLDTSINIKKAAKKIYFVPDGSPGIDHVFMYTVYHKNLTNVMTCFLLIIYYTQFFIIFITFISTIQFKYVFYNLLYKV